MTGIAREVDVLGLEFCSLPGLGCTSGARARAVTPQEHVPEVGGDALQQGDELSMDRNRLLLIGGAMVLALFLAFLFAPGGILPR